MSDDRRTVLVAEDEYLVRLLVVDDLTTSGFDVIEAGHGLDAMEILKRETRVDALVTNISMPGADGIAVALAARHQYPELPVIFISATPQRLVSCPDLAPYHCISKPFETSDLVRLVRRLLDVGQARETSRP